MALIDKRELIKNSAFFTEDEDGFSVCVVLENDIRNAPEVEVVRKEQYDKLRNTFLDFVYSGIHNAAPYCKNKNAGCVDECGWCVYRKCNGFNPDGMAKEK